MVAGPAEISCWKCGRYRRNKKCRRRNVRRRIRPAKATKRGCPAQASATIAKRCAKGSRSPAACAADGRAGMKWISSRWKRRSAARATARWPTWIGIEGAAEKRDAARAPVAGCARASAAACCSTLLRRASAAPARWTLRRRLAVISRGDHPAVPRGAASGRAHRPWRAPVAGMPSPLAEEMA